MSRFDCISLLLIALLRTLFLTSCLVVPLQAQVISEAMPAPESGCQEWIELNLRYVPFETLGQECTIRIEDPTKSVSIDIRPEHYILVFAKDSSTLSDCHHIPDTSVIVQASLPSLNNSGDEITVTIESAYGTYEEHVEFGKERVQTGVTWETNGVGQVTLCTFPDGNTCGYLNSTTQIRADAFTFALSFERDHIEVEVTNAGYSFADSVVVHVSSNLDSVAWSTQQTISSIPSESSALALFPFEESTTHVLVHVSVTHANNTRTYNDTVTKSLFRPVPRSAVLINEFLISPSDTQVEAIELYNNSTAPIQLQGWRLCDALKQAGRDTVVLRNSYLLHPETYCTVIWDSVSLSDTTFEHLVIASGELTLNNSGDDIILLGPALHTVDSLAYKDSWHSSGIDNTEGLSLERLSPHLHSTDKDSWVSSSDEHGHTLGTQNSRWMQTSERGTLVVTPQLWNRDMFPNGVVVNYNLPFSAMATHTTLYTESGEFLSTLDESEIGPGEQSFLWNPLDTFSSGLSPGVYVLVVQARSLDTGEHATCMSVFAVH